MELRDAINLQEAYLNVYAPEDLKEDYEIAAEYFYEQGLNDDGVAILIEELGIDEFTEWVEDILEDYDLMERKLSAGETTLPARSRRKIVGGEIGAPRAFSNPESAKTAGGKRRAARAAARETTPTQTARQKDLATRLAAQKERNAAKEKAKSTQAPTPKSEAPTQTKRGIGGLLKTVVDRAKADTEKVKQSWQTASDTKLAQRARIAAKRGSRAVEKHGAAVGSAAGRAVGTAVGATLRAGRQAGQSETGQRLKKGLGDAVKKAVFKEEVEEWVESLIDEGYDLSDYTWEDMYDLYEDNVHVDYYDVILDHLLDEGYANTVDSALSIMANMSEDWREQIIDEAQRILKVTSPSGRVKYKEGETTGRIRNAIGRLPADKRAASQRRASNRNDSANRRSIENLNAIDNIDARHGNDGDNDYTSYNSRSGYREVPTNYRARKRRASGR